MTNHRFITSIYLDDKHPHSPPRVEKVHGVLVQLVKVEGVDALLGAHEDVLVVSLRVYPGRSAVDPEGAAVENLWMWKHRSLILKDEKKVRFFIDCD